MQHRQSVPSHYTGAVKPASHPNLTIQIIKMYRICWNNAAFGQAHDVLIHSMAVSDYAPIYMAEIIKSLSLQV